jgi:uncharacterized surface protein with fasciclin (FAS1) repeats
VSSGIRTANGTVYLVDTVLMPAADQGASPVSRAQVAV